MNLNQRYTFNLKSKEHLTLIMLNLYLLKQKKIVMSTFEVTDFKNLPVYNKALEIFKVSRAIACSISDNKNILEMSFSANFNHQFAGEIVSDSLQLAPGLATVQCTSNPLLRLRRAKQIRKALNRILSGCKKLEFDGVREKEFLTILRAEILQFDHLFSEWFHKIQLNRKEN